jgi:universal stress protein A
MEIYKHILLAVDFFDNDTVVSNRAKELADRYQATLSIVHVVDNMPVTDSSYGLDLPFDLDLAAELMAAAKNKLAKLAGQLVVSENRTYLEMGSPKQEIIRIANENNADLIVVGSHGRHGLALLLGSTANAILHHAKCDVLAVRLKDN